MTHGSRSMYITARCRCFACRLANTQYMADRRALARAQKQPLGALMTPREARRRLTSLLIEGWTRQQLGPLLGMGQATVYRLTSAQRVRLKTVLKIRRAYRSLLGND